jgi:hypothetical protein
MKIKSLINVGLFGLLGIVMENCSSSDVPAPQNCSNSDLQLTEVSSTDVSSCLSTDGAIEVAASGGTEPYQYRIGNSTFQNSPVFQNLAAGTYVITVKDASGCESLLSNVSVESNSTLTATIEKENNSICSTTVGNGTITVNASGGTGIYQYKLNNGDFVANNVFGNLKNGTYQVVVKDEAGCLFNLSATIQQGDAGIRFSSAAQELNNVRLIFQTHCFNCHSWTNYQTAFNSRASIKTRTQNGSMPPGGGLSDDEKAKIACWVDAGGPQ